MIEAPLTGLVLTAGGARGAYQAGVLKRLSEIPAFRQFSPFQIITGASAGAINGAALAAGTQDFRFAARLVARLWSNLKTDEIFRTDFRTFGKLAVRWFKDLSLGGAMGGGSAESLLDATPLRKVVETHLHPAQIQAAIDSGRLFALGVTATNYHSGKSYTFIQGREGHPTWHKSRRTTVSGPLNIDHICASAAIPVIFQPIQVSTDHGVFYFGDGALRLTTPLSPAIRLGARKVIAIGIRSQKAAEKRMQAEQLQFATEKPVIKRPALSQIIGVIMNAIFLDHLDADLEHLLRINKIVEIHGLSEADTVKIGEPIRKVDAIVVHPSTNLSEIAESCAMHMPGIVRYFLEGLGTSRAESADLISYLLFEKTYTQALVDLGYRDAHERADEVEAFLRTT